VSEIDECYRRAQAGDEAAFAAWVRRCDLPLRKSLRSFAPAVDVESVLQEGLLRMWRLAPTLVLAGQNASLRYALRLVRNLAISEGRRRGAEIDDDDAKARPKIHVAPDPPPDEGLRRAVERCLEKLPPRPRVALLARLRGGPDRELAAGVGMRPNTFLQNIVRARRLMAECLRAAGVRLEDYLP
jgi:DNA-directed RNA polymerase specialized sigma24 family protein